MQELMVTDDERQERQARVHALTLAGLSARQIADCIGCSRRQVARDRKHLGLTRRPAHRPLTDDQIGRAEALLDDGCSRAEVARTLGVDESTIRRRFPDRGWTPEQIAEHTAILRKGR